MVNFFIVLFFRWNLMDTWSCIQLLTVTLPFKTMLHQKAIRQNLALLNIFRTSARAATLKLNIRHGDGDGVVIITFQTTQPNQTTTPCQYCQGRHHGGGLRGLKPPPLKKRIR